MPARLVRTKISRAIEPFRAGEWWDHKLAQMLGTGYMTAFFLRLPLLHLWPTFVASLVGVAAAAAYVSVVNDLTDLEDDAKAGKYNRLAHRSRRYASTAIAALVGVGLLVAVLAWRDDPLALALFAGPWVAFSLYSLPPVRLKARGFAGMLADASGAHLFPHLLIAAAVFSAGDRRLDGAWLAAVGTWALASGVRGALWHQLGDVAADDLAGVNTFGRRHPRRGLYLGRAAFAIELAAFLYLLWRAGSALPFVLFAPYALLELARMRMWGVRLIAVRQVPTHRIAMHAYYLFFYPLAFLVASSLRHPAGIVVLVVHTALFPRLALAEARDVEHGFTRLAAGLRTAAAPPGRSRS